MSQPHNTPTAEQLNSRFGAAPAEVALAMALDHYDGRIAMVSSFGADAAVLLHMLSVTDPTVPVIMLDTAFLFPETLQYQQDLTRHLGLTDVRVIQPDESDDADRTLHKRDTTACCQLRKVRPLERAMQGVDAQITGRKRFQTKARRGMQTFEDNANGRVVVSPLTHWTSKNVASYFETHDLPRHPLVGRGYPSIGCAPCTKRVEQGADPRSGRWQGEAREECGIHFGANGTVERRVR